MLFASSTRRDGSVANTACCRFWRGPLRWKPECTSHLRPGRRRSAAARSAGAGSQPLVRSDARERQHRPSVHDGASARPRISGTASPRNGRGRSEHTGLARMALEGEAQRSAGGAGPCARGAPCRDIGGNGCYRAESCTQPSQVRGARVSDACCGPAAVGPDEQAIADACAAVAVAREILDPALQLYALGAHLAVEGSMSSQPKPSRCTGASAPRFRITR